MIRVLVGARSSAARATLETTVRSSPSLEFAGSLDLSQLESSSLSSRELLADVLLIQGSKPHDFDWQALADSRLPVILLLDATDSNLVTMALRSGARGAISGDATPQEIDGAVHAVYAGLAVMMPVSLAEILPDAPAFTEELAEPLSERELEVLDLLAEGLSNKLIAHRLNISEHTVKTHVASIFAKLGASTRTEAVSRAIRRGLVML